MPTFSPPTWDVVPPFFPETRGPVLGVMRHFKARARGRSVLKIAGTYQRVDMPSQTQVDSATEVYLGGHTYPVTQAVADALTAAGYGSGIS